VNGASSPAEISRARKTLRPAQVKALTPSATRPKSTSAITRNIPNKACETRLAPLATPVKPIAPAMNEMMSATIAQVSRVLPFPSLLLLPPLWTQAVRAAYESRQTRESWPRAASVADRWRLRRHAGIDGLDRLVAELFALVRGEIAERPQIALVQARQ